MAPTKKITVVLDTPQEKKSVTRYNNTEEGAAMTSAYVNKDDLATIGNPDKIKITIEAA